jgi:hypothetical protein
MCQNVTQGESDYLKSKGLNGLTYPLLTNGAILLPLVDNTVRSLPHKPLPRAGKTPCSGFSQTRSIPRH